MVPVVPVLVIELDEGVRDGLHALLNLAGYDMLDDASTVEAGLTLLDTCPHSLVVLVGNAYPDHRLVAQFFAHVVADPRLATQHHYILLSSSPTHLPPSVAEYIERLHAEVCPKPFDMDTLLACVARATERLAASHPVRAHGTHNG